MDEYTLEFQRCRQFQPLDQTYRGGGKNKVSISCGMETEKNDDAWSSDHLTSTQCNINCSDIFDT